MFVADEIELDSSPPKTILFLVPSRLLFGVVVVICPSLSLSPPLCKLDGTTTKEINLLVVIFFTIFLLFFQCLLALPNRFFCFFFHFFSFEENFHSILYDAPIQYPSCLSSYVILFWAIHKLFSMPLPISSPSFCVFCCTVRKGSHCMSRVLNLIE